jgi:Transglycosylase SLT domain
MIALLAIGCAGGIKSKPGSTSSASRQERGKTAQKTSTKRAPRRSSGEGSVATRTRAVTKNRQGSWSLTSEKVKDISRLVSRASKEYKIPEDLIYGIIWVESRFNPKAVSPVGARGLMQLMPATAKYLAECIEWSGRSSSFNTQFNVMAGSYYIARLISSFDGDEKLALAAYNAGPTKVRRWLKSSGLPKVSIEYATMVQTARGFFGGKGKKGSGGGSAAPIVTDDDLDRLGLAILIAGLSDKQFGLERTDEARPFN